MKMDPVLSLLSLSRKAGKLKSGTFQVEESVKKFKSHLVICATDSSDRRKDDVKNMCEFYEVPYLYYGTKEELGGCIGKTENAVLSVEDEKLALSIVKKADTSSF